MNEIIKFLLLGDNFMPEIRLRQPTQLGKSGFPCSACGPFTQNQERIKKFKEAADSKYIYQNKLDETCIQYYMIYGDFLKILKNSY